MTHPWRIIAAALLCCYAGLWLLRYLLWERLSVGQRDRLMLLALVVEPVGWAVLVWGWGR